MCLKIFCDLCDGPIKYISFVLILLIVSIRLVFFNAVDTYIEATP